MAVPERYRTNARQQPTSKPSIRQAEKAWLLGCGSRGPDLPAPGHQLIGTIDSYYPGVYCRAVGYAISKNDPHTPRSVAAAIPSAALIATSRH